MPFSVETVTTRIQGDDAIASGVCIVTDEAGTELARETITARANHNLRADDPNRRGMRVDAAERLQQLLAEEAAAVAAKALVEALPLAKFEGLAEGVATLVAAKAAEVEAIVAAEKLRLETVPEVVVKDLGTGTLETKEVLADG